MSVFKLKTVLVLLSLGCIWTARGEDAAALFHEANKLYEQGGYVQAAHAYESLLETGRVSSTIYFNYGNALFQSGQKGRAIAAYRRAAKLSPRDPDVRANLQFVRGQVEGDYAPPRSRSAWVERLTLNEWTLLASIAAILFFAMLVARQVRPALKETLRAYTVAAGLFAALLSAFLFIAAQREFSPQTVVVIVSEAVVRRGPFDESQAAFTARDGAELIVLDRKGQWLQVGDGANRIGWMREKGVMPVY